MKPPLAGNRERQKHKHTNTRRTFNTQEEEDPEKSPSEGASSERCPPLGRDTPAGAPALLPCLLDLGCSWYHAAKDSLHEDKRRCLQIRRRQEEAEEEEDGASSAWQNGGWGVGWAERQLLKAVKILLLNL